MTRRPVNPYPSADDIAQRAHELFVAGGRRISLIPAYWRTAERELLEQAADCVTSLNRRAPHVRVRPQK